MNKLLIGNEKPVGPFDAENFLFFHESFRSIFENLEKDKSLKEVMKELLEKFKQYYKETDQLLDFTGQDNVIFYKDGESWQYKVGSVIKSETGKKTISMMHEIETNPAIVKECFENWTLIYFVPSWVRVVNATAAKLGMERIVENISISQHDSENLAKIYEMLLLSERAVRYAEHQDFETALNLFEQYESSEKNHDT